MWQLFNASPAKHEVYTTLYQVNTSSVFQKKFCKTCWMEKEHVISRALDI